MTDNCENGNDTPQPILQEISALYQTLERVYFFKTHLHLKRVDFIPVEPNIVLILLLPVPSTTAYDILWLFSQKIAQQQ